MTVPFTRSLNPAIRDVNRGLAAARDAQIERVVAMVDAMPVRGEADQIIAPLRPRLARLRPPRPLRFARLMFLPLDPLIVPATRWRPGDHSLPRTAIPVLAAAMEEAPGAVVQSVAAMILGRTTQDRAIVEAAGALLWPHAAAALLTCPAPADWDTTGLGPRTYLPLARSIAALLSQAVVLRRLTADAAEGLVPPEPGGIQALLAGAWSVNPDVQPMMIALLLAHIPEAAPVLAKLLSSLDQSDQVSMRRAEELAAEVLLEQLESPGGAEGQLGGEDLVDVAATVRRLTALLTVLEVDPIPPGRRDRVAELRRRIQTSCQSLFNERLTADLLEPLYACSSPDGAWGLETAARGLRALETEARRAGGDAVYNGLLRDAADSVRAVVVAGKVGQAGGLRLMEILAGPDVALALLGEEADCGP